MVKNKEYYIKKYNESFEQCYNNYIAEVGNDNNFDSSLHDDLTAEEIVVYYLNFYGSQALSEWENNLKISNNKFSTDKEVTKTLKKLFSKNIVLKYINR